MEGQFVLDKISLEASRGCDSWLKREDALKLLELVKGLENSLTELLRFTHERNRRQQPTAS